MLTAEVRTEGAFFEEGGHSLAKAIGARIGAGEPRIAGNQSRIFRHYAEIAGERQSESWFWNPWRSADRDG
jgi:hypothetical protein